MQNLPGENLEERKRETAFCLLEERVKSGKSLDFEVSSHSMLPTLIPGDIVTIRNIAIGELRKGDLAVFRISNNNLCVHRYIYKSQNDGNPFKLVTKGDNFPDFDRWLVSSEDLFGKVISIKKKDGEINLEGIFWRISNYLLAFISSFQIRMVKFTGRIRRFLWKDKRIPFATPIKRVLFFPCPFLLKSILFIHKGFKRF